MIVFPFRDNWKEIHVLITQFIHSHYERKGVLCEKWLSKFLSNLYVLRPFESEKNDENRSIFCFWKELYEKIQNFNTGFW